MPPPAEAFVGFLAMRRHLFDIAGDMVGAVKGASALLQVSWPRCSSP